jgi:PKD repeat protein
MTQTRSSALVAVLLLASCGSSTSPTVVPSSPVTAPSTAPSAPAGNHAPTAAIADVQPRTPALSGGTVVTFSATGDDADGDVVTFTWDFGDGETGEGPGVAHVFKGEGDHQVTLTASDPHGAQATAQATITVRTLNGAWHGAAAAPAVRLIGSLQQGGAGFSGTMIGGITMSGRVGDPHEIVMDVDGLCGSTVRFRGSMDDSLQSMTLKAGDNCAQYKELQLFRD